MVPYLSVTWEVSREDGLPGTVCLECLKKVTEFKHFKTRCIQSKITILTVIAGRGIVEIPREPSAAANAPQNKDALPSKPAAVADDGGTSDEPELVDVIEDDSADEAEKKEKEKEAAHSRRDKKHSGKRKKGGKKKEGHAPKTSLSVSNGHLKKNTKVPETQPICVVEDDEPELVEIIDDDDDEPETGGGGEAVETSSSLKETNNDRLNKDCPSSGNSSTASHGRRDEDHGSAKRSRVEEKGSAVVEPVKESKASKEGNSSKTPVHRPRGRPRKDGPSSGDSSTASHVRRDEDHGSAKRSRLEEKVSAAVEPVKESKASKEGNSSKTPVHRPRGRPRKITRTPPVTPLVSQGMKEKERSSSKTSSLNRTEGERAKPVDDAKDSAVAEKDQPNHPSIGHKGGNKRLRCERVENMLLQEELNSFVQGLDNDARKESSDAKWSLAPWRYEPHTVDEMESRLSASGSDGTPNLAKVVDASMEKKTSRAAKVPAPAASGSKAVDCARNPRNDEGSAVEPANNTDSRNKMDNRAMATRGTTKSSGRGKKHGTNTSALKRKSSSLTGSEDEVSTSNVTATVNFIEVPVTSDVIDIAHEVDAEATADPLAPIKVEPSENSDPMPSALPRTRVPGAIYDSVYSNLGPVKEERVEAPVGAVMNHQPTGGQMTPAVPPLVSASAAEKEPIVNEEIDMDFEEQKYSATLYRDAERVQQNEDPLRPVGKGEEINFIAIVPQISTECATPFEEVAEDPFADASECGNAIEEPTADPPTVDAEVIGGVGGNVPIPSAADNLSQSGSKDDRNERIGVSSSSGGKPSKELDVPVPKAVKQLTGSIIAGLPLPSNCENSENILSSSVKELGKPSVDTASGIMSQSDVMSEQSCATIPGNVVNQIGKFNVNLAGYGAAGSQPAGSGVQLDFRIAAKEVTNDTLQSTSSSDAASMLARISELNLGRRFPRVVLERLKEDVVNRVSMGCVESQESRRKLNNQRMDSGPELIELNSSPSSPDHAAPALASVPGEDSVLRGEGPGDRNMALDEPSHSGTSGRPREERTTQRRKRTTSDRSSSSSESDEWVPSAGSDLETSDANSEISDADWKDNVNTRTTKAARSKSSHRSKSNKASCKKARWVPSLSAVAQPTMAQSVDERGFSLRESETVRYQMYMSGTSGMQKVNLVKRGLVLCAVPDIPAPPGVGVKVAQSVDDSINKRTGGLSGSSDSASKGPPLITRIQKSLTGGFVISINQGKGEQLQSQMLASCQVEKTQGAMVTSVPSNSGSSSRDRAPNIQIISGQTSDKSRMLNICQNASDLGSVWPLMAKQNPMPLNVIHDTQQKPKLATIQSSETSDSSDVHCRDGTVSSCVNLAAAWEMPKSSSSLQFAPLKDDSVKDAGLGKSSLSSEGANSSLPAKVMFTITPNNPRGNEDTTGEVAGKVNVASKDVVHPSMLSAPDNGDPKVSVTQNSESSASPERDLLEDVLGAIFGEGPHIPGKAKDANDVDGKAVSSEGPGGDRTVTNQAATVVKPAESVKTVGVNVIPGPSHLDGDRTGALDLSSKKVADVDAGSPTPITNTSLEHFGSPVILKNMGMWDHDVRKIVSSSSDHQYVKPPLLEGHKTLESIDKIPTVSCVKTSSSSLDEAKGSSVIHIVRSTPPGNVVSLGSIKNTSGVNAPVIFSTDSKNRSLLISSQAKTCETDRAVSGVVEVRQTGVPDVNGVVQKVAIPRIGAGVNLGRVYLGVHLLPNSSPNQNRIKLLPNPEHKKSSASMELANANANPVQDVSSPMTLPQVNISGVNFMLKSGSSGVPSGGESALNVPGAIVSSKASMLEKILKDYPSKAAVVSGVGGGDAMQGSTVQSPQGAPQKVQSSCPVQSVILLHMGPGHTDRSLKTKCIWCNEMLENMVELTSHLNDKHREEVTKLGKQLKENCGGNANGDSVRSVAKPEGGTLVESAGTSNGESNSVKRPISLQRGEFKCRYCPEVFEYKHLLKDHKKVFHSSKHKGRRRQKLDRSASGEEGPCQQTKTGPEFYVSPRGVFMNSSSGNAKGGTVGENPQAATMGNAEGTTDTVGDANRGDRSQDPSGKVSGSTWDCVGVKKNPIRTDNSEGSVSNIPDTGTIAQNSRRESVITYPDKRDATAPASLLSGVKKDMGCAVREIDPGDQVSMSGSVKKDVTADERLGRNVEAAECSTVHPSSSSSSAYKESSSASQESSSAYKGSSSSACQEVSSASGTNPRTSNKELLSKFLYAEVPVINCPKCTLSFRSILETSRHLIEYHKVSASDIQIEAEDEKARTVERSESGSNPKAAAKDNMFKCPMCTLKFDTFLEYKRHFGKVHMPEVYERQKQKQIDKLYKGTDQGH